jgi:hypothetical protein
MEELAEDDMTLSNASVYRISIVIGPVNASVLLLFFIIGLPWNALVIGIILKKKLFTRPSVMLMLNLAIANFFICLLFLPFNIVLGVLVKGFNQEEFVPMDKACGAFVLQIALIITSIYIVALMSLDRAVYLKRPLTYKDIVTPWRMFFAIVIVWIFCAALGLPPLVGFGRVGYVPSLVTCSIYNRDPSDPHNKSYPAYLILVVTFATIGTLIQLVGCACIIYITRKHYIDRLRRVFDSVRHREHQDFNRQTRRSMRRILESQSSSASIVLSNYNKSQIQLVKVFGAIFIVSMLTVVPFLAFGTSVLIIGDRMSLVKTILHPISYMSMISRSVIYPILEAYMTYETRDVIKRFFSTCTKRLPCCGMKSNNDAVSSRVESSNPSCAYENSEEQEHKRLSHSKEMANELV